MTWTELSCIVLLVAIIICVIVYAKKCDEEWEQVVSWSEYKAANKAYSALLAQPSYDVGTYARFKNVRTENLRNYIEPEHIDKLLDNRREAKKKLAETIPLLRQLSGDAKYGTTKRRLDKLIYNLSVGCNSVLTVSVFYRTTKKSEMRQKSFLIRESEWKRQDEILKEKESSHKTFAQEQRNRITKKVRFAVLQRDNFTCQYCGAHGPGVVLEVDHIIPISKGGTSDMDNLITACFDCNRGKGDAMIDSTDRDSTHDAPLQTRE